MSVDRAVRAAAHPTVATLARDAELLTRIVADRPALVCEALLGGASPEQVAAALGWTVAEVHGAVGRWAPRLRRAGQLTEPQCTALLGGAPT